MEIQKVFSDYYDTERMYSVLMSEDELRFYSELQKEFGIKEALGKYISKAKNGASKFWERMKQKFNKKRQSLADRVNKFPEENNLGMSLWEDHLGAKRQRCLEIWNELNKH